MNAIVILDKKKANIVLTNIDNIDWEDKTIINNSDIDELELLLDDTVSIFDIERNSSMKIKVNYLDTDKHQLIINKKRFIALHILK